MKGQKTGGRTMSPERQKVREIVREDWPRDVLTSEIIARIKREVPDCPAWLLKPRRLGVEARLAGVSRTDVLNMKGSGRRGYRKPDAEKVQPKPTRARGGIAIWPPEVLDAIKVMWLAGDSAGTIATALNGKFCDRELKRNSVCSIVYRSGWTRNPIIGEVNRAIQPSRGRKKVAKAANQLKPKLTGRPVKLIVVDEFHKLPALPPPPPPAPEVGLRRSVFDPVVFEGAANVLIFDRGDGCGYITGEGAAGAVYCGKAVDRSTRQKAYCADHHRVVYQAGTGMRKETQRRVQYHGR